jgi:hypothetical protein
LQQSVATAQGVPLPAHCTRLEMQVLLLGSHKPEQQPPETLHESPKRPQLTPEGKLAASP